MSDDTAYYARKARRAAREAMILSALGMLSAVVALFLALTGH